MHLTFRSFGEDEPGDAWRKVFAHGWPGWSEWFRARSDGNPSLGTARKSLRRHMPEYESLWDELNTVAGADDEAARFLSFWSPPRYLVNCSQAVIVDDDGPFLIRNYDLDPQLNESTLFSTGWRGRRVVGMVEAMSGLSDGMNDAGLAVSLTFGGRVVRGSGFGIPLILRYVLQICTDVPEALEALRAVPSHMSYNVTLIDRSGDWATVFLAPDRRPIVTRQPWATNHQLGVEWPRHGRISKTVARGRHLERVLARPGLDAETLAAEFRSSPLFCTRYAQGFGTVFTASYRPLTGAVSLSWRDGTVERWTLSEVTRRQRRIVYTQSGSQADPAAETPAPMPDWYDQFMQSAPLGSVAEDDEDARTMLAAFWRRNHLGHDHGWSNLTPLPTKQKNEEER